MKLKPIEGREPNCAGFLIKTLQMGEDGYYEAEDLLPLFEDARDEPAEAVFACVRNLVPHITPYDPNRPNKITHRPHEGARVSKNNTFYNAIGKYLDAYPTMMNIRFMKRKKEIDL